MSVKIISFNLILVPVSWCSIRYYNYNQKVGDTFHVAKDENDVFVDAGLDPDSPNRFCLGCIINIEKDELVECCK